MFGWLQRGSSTPGWLAVSFDETSLEFAHARRVRGGRARVSSYGAFGPTPIERAKREHRLGAYQCTTMLCSGEYDLLLVEAPQVPRAEMKSALRWKVKDMVDYAIDEATIDFLEVPSQPGMPAGRSQQLYAVLARNDVVRRRIRRFEDAGLPLQVIDIPETAQRNIAALFEKEERGVALAYFAADWGLLTITQRGELYYSRRLDIGIDALAEDSYGSDGGPLERVALEIQRTLDHCERHFRHVVVGQILIAPGNRPHRLQELLQARFETPVRTIDLAEAVAFDAPPDAATQARLFHHFGAALREAAL